MGSARPRCRYIPNHCQQILAFHSVVVRKKLTANGGLPFVPRDQPSFAGLEPLAYPRPDCRPAVQGSNFLPVSCGSRLVRVRHLGDFLAHATQLRRDRQNSKRRDSTRMRPSKERRNTLYQVASSWMPAPKSRLVRSVSNLAPRKKRSPRSGRFRRTPYTTLAFPSSSGHSSMG